MGFYMVPMRILELQLPRLAFVSEGIWDKRGLTGGVKGMLLLLGAVVHIF